jgi:Icc-related predicted phosphoesterase
MKIQIHSDLHLEFEQYYPVPEADILVLAGDIIVAHFLNSNGELYTRFKDFFKYISSNFKKTYYVLGNHEFYKSSIEMVKDYIQDFFMDEGISNIIILDDFVAIHDEVLFIGSTLWTDCNKEDPLTMFHLRDRMNDFKVIREASRGYLRFRPERSCILHDRSKQFIDHVLSGNSLKSVVITHHAPSFMSVSDDYKSDTLMNGGYASDLSNLILDREPDIWIHGHMHHRIDYMLGNTRILANPRGYGKENLNYSNLVIEV